MSIQGLPIADVPDPTKADGAAVVGGDGSGAPGAQGPAGATGPAGPGLPAGGAVGQIPAKASTTDYHTGWVSVREVLTAARTYYVATTGNDANDGLAVGTPFATIQKAVDIVAGLDTSIYATTIQIADGTYTETVGLKRTVGSIAPMIQGNLSNKAAVVVQGSNANGTFNVSGFGVVYTVKFMTLKSGPGNGVLLNANSGGFISCTDLVFSTNSSPEGPHINVNRMGRIAFTGPYEIASGATAHIYMYAGGQFLCQFKTITLTGTPAFSVAYVDTNTCAVAQIDGNTYNGSATGKRYNAALNSVIYSTVTLPGNVAGTVVTGGQYA